jgi:hypothetical protein
MLDSPLNPQIMRLNWDLVNVHASAFFLWMRKLTDIAHHPATATPQSSVNFFFR